MRLLAATCRGWYCAAGHVRPGGANVINAIGDWALIYGHLGMPALGVTGSGWATLIARIYMAGVLVVYTLYHELTHHTRLQRPRMRLDPGRLGQLLGLGLPAALHVTLEVGVFAAATALVAMLDPIALAAHHIVLDIASVTYMIPLGLASAGAVRVGQALGRGEPVAASHAGWAALLLGAGFMGLAGAVMATLPDGLASLFTTDPAVIATAATLLVIAAAFQLFDGLQGVSTGTMRGAGDTHTAMICNLVAHWVIGLPLGYLLCFIAGLGVVGIWIGRALGLAAAGVYLLRARWLKSRALARGEFALAAQAE
ncbi:MAG: MATE family efflux transporter [Isosphaeraceae bacterium]